MHQLDSVARSLTHTFGAAKTRPAQQYAPHGHGAYMVIMSRTHVPPELDMDEMERRRARLALSVLFYWLRLTPPPRYGLRVNV